MINSLHLCCYCNNLSFSCNFSAYFVVSVRLCHQVVYWSLSFNSFVHLFDSNVLSELRSFIGLTEFYGRFISRLSTLREPLTRLLKHDKHFRWTNDQQTAFNNLKNILSGDTMVTPFNPNNKITLICDALLVGIGAILEQNGQPVTCVSKTLTTAEKGYPQIEREVLAIVWSIERLHKYLFGRKFTVVTNKKPLFFLCNPGKAIPVMTAARLQRWLIITILNIEKAQTFKVQTHYQDITRIMRLMVFLMSTIFRTLYCWLQLTSLASDKRVKWILISGMFARVSWTVSMVPLLLTILNFDMKWLFKTHCCIEVSDSLFQSVCNRKCWNIGTDAMKSIARQCVWWPTIDHDIDRWAKSCEGCCKGKNHPKSMWTSWPEEQEKWSRVHVDLCGPFYDGSMALVMVDAFTKWPEVHLLKSTTSNDIIKRLCDEPSLEKVHQSLW